MTEEELMKDAEGGNPHAKFLLARHYLENHDEVDVVRTAVSLLEDAAGEGVSEAVLLLARKSSHFSQLIFQIDEQQGTDCLVDAHTWLTIYMRLSEAAEDHSINLSRFNEILSDDQIAMSRRRASEWLASHPNIKQAS